MTVLVPELKEKLRTLREFRVPPLSRKNLLADLGIAADSTLRWYESGDATREPGRVPPNVRVALVALLVSSLPGRRSDAEVAALLEGPAGALRTAFLAGSAVIWRSLVDRAAATIGGRLVREADVEFGLVEIDGPDEPGPDPEEPSVNLGERFFLVFAVPVSGYHVVLQLAQREWVGVPFVSGDFVREEGAGELTVPDADRFGRRRFLVERRDVGRHRFVCVSTRAPLPSGTVDALRHGTVDRASLDQLASFYEDQPQGNRHMIALDVTVTVPGSP